jgi:hypothetical protein
MRALTIGATFWLERQPYPPQRFDLHNAAHKKHVLFRRLRAGSAAAPLHDVPHQHPRLT